MPPSNQPPLTVSLSLAVGGCRRQHRGVSGEGGGGPRKGAQDFQISSHGSGRNHSAGRRSTKLRAKRGPSAPGLSAIYRAAAPPSFPPRRETLGVTSEVTTIQKTGGVCRDLSPPFAPFLRVITEKPLTVRPLNEPIGGATTATEVLFAGNPQTCHQTTWQSSEK